LDPEQSVLQYHHHSNRDGLYVQPRLSKAAAATMHRDLTFDGTVDGNVYAQPLYVENGANGKGTFYVVTENDWVYALGEGTGETVWRKNFGPSASITGAGCGNVLPLGITGTPVIDMARRAIFFDAAVGTGTGTNPIKTHLLHAISIDDGSELVGWPVDVAGTKFQNLTFDPVVQNQRSALIIVDRILYVAYGGHAGDCGGFHGWVIGIPLDRQAPIGAWAANPPTFTGAGIWGPGGLASDGTNLFATTGNSFGLPPWSGGEAVIRLQGGPVFSGNPADYFTPSNWEYLDAHDLDLAGSGPIVVDVPSMTPSKLVVALGKNGVAYLLNRDNLGGLGKGNGLYGEGAFSALLTMSPIINAAAAFNSPRGTFFVFHIYNSGAGICPTGQAGDLVGLRLGGAKVIDVVWCRDNGGQGSPIITTLDGENEGIVWSAGAEGSQRLHAWDAETGQPLFAGGGGMDLMAAVRRFTTPIAVHGRVFVGADGELFAFAN
jgi:outer membrane protein assembly factor BamB